MAIKLIMDSGKEYVVQYEGSIQSFVSSLYNDIKISRRKTIKLLMNGLYYVDEERNIIINPSHISSIEFVDKE